MIGCERFGFSTEKLESRPVQPLPRAPENLRPSENVDIPPAVDPRVHHMENVPTPAVQLRGKSLGKAKKMDRINLIFPIAKVPEHSTIAPVVVVVETSTLPPVNPAKSKSPSLITKPVIAANHAHIHQFSVNQAEYQEEKAERSRQTVGAAWALTLGNIRTCMLPFLCRILIWRIYFPGLSVTAVLVLLVGCRLRSLKRHLRARGRGGHTRDADYLVNGMYL